MTYDELTEEGKKWFNALYDISGGDINPDTADQYATDMP